MSITYDLQWCNFNNAVILYRAKAADLICIVQHVACFLSPVHAVGVDLTLDVFAVCVMCLICLLTAWVIGEQSSTFTQTACRTASAQLQTAGFGVAILC